VSEPLFYTKIEIGCIDTNEDIRSEFQDSLDKPATQSEQSGQVTDDLIQTHDGQFSQIPPDFKARRLHHGSADSGKTDTWFLFPDSPDQCSTEEIA
jgi:hypothetical protein